MRAPADRATAQPLLLPLLRELAGAPAPDAFEDAFMSAPPSPQGEGPARRANFDDSRVFELLDEFNDCCHPGGHSYLQQGGKLVCQHCRLEFDA